MLSINSYPKAYIAACRARIEAQMQAYAALGASSDAFEEPFFKHMLLALDHYFDHRSRVMEDKNGNPLNELRLLCNGIMHNGGKLGADKQIKLDPARSVLGLKAGDDIRLSAETFNRLAQAVFAEIEHRYP